MLAASTRAVCVNCLPFACNVTVYSPSAIGGGAFPPRPPSPKYTPPSRHTPASASLQWSHALSSVETGWGVKLRDAYEKSVAIAYGLNAFECRIKGISQLHESGQESWLVTLEPTANDRGGIFYEMAINGLSVDQIATLRARRILLNESIHHHSVSMVNHLSTQMIEHLPDGGEKYLGKLHCPFLELYARLGQDPDYFLAVARLFAVLHLRLTGIIKNILKLELKLKK